MSEVSIVERKLIVEVAGDIRECEENPGCYSWKLTAEEIVKRCKAVLVAEHKRQCSIAEAEARSVR